MAIDPALLERYFQSTTLAKDDTAMIAGVRIELPRSRSAANKQRDWQRRVLPDMMPDSVNADAPERTPLKLVHALTGKTKPAVHLADIPDRRHELTPLVRLFQVETRTGQRFPVAFHVLAVKSAKDREQAAKGFTERSILLMCRHADGTLDEPLVRRLVEQFRRHPDHLDLAQRTILQQLDAEWTPEREPSFEPPAKQREVPFDPATGALFREDLTTLLEASLAPSDFFLALNQLFAFHLGLFQARLAAILNPAMDSLYAFLAGAGEAALVAQEQREEGWRARHPFAGTLNCRAPDPGMMRIVRPTDLARTSFQQHERETVRLHFSLLVFGQIRRLTEAWLRTEIPDIAQDALEQQCQTPLQIMRRLHERPDFRAYFDEALTMLCARFIHNQLAKTDNERDLADVLDQPTPLHGLRRLYEIYNQRSARNATASRAWRQGPGMTGSLLRQGQYGLVETRRGLGSYFEIGTGFLPLLLLLVVRRDEKRPLVDLWRRLDDYGLRLEPDEQEILLARLRAMGVYERFSDAGEAAYIHNLMATTQE